MKGDLREGREVTIEHFVSRGILGSEAKVGAHRHVIKNHISLHRFRLNTLLPAAEGTRWAHDVLFDEDELQAFVDYIIQIGLIKKGSNGK